jgi:hypothetical protein
MNNIKTNTLLTCGIIAGPFFVIASFVHGLMREGYDHIRHPASLLSLGELGWVQITIFILTGLLYLASAVGLRRVLTIGIGSWFVSPLFFIIGLAYIAGGVFVADPSLGFPPGAIAGVPSQMSWHAVVHGFAPVVGSIALVAALIILGRRFGSKGQKSWMWISIIVALATFVLSSMSSFTGNWETGEFNFLPLWAGVALGYGYTSLLIAKLKGEL